MAKKRSNSAMVLDLFQYKVSLTESQYLLQLAKEIVKRREIEEGIVAPRKKGKRKNKVLDALRTGQPVSPEV